MVAVVAVVVVVVVVAAVVGLVPVKSNPEALAARNCVELTAGSSSSLERVRSTKGAAGTIVGFCGTRGG